MRLNERNIFLLDGLGAVWSAISTGAILPLFFEWTQLPLKVSYALAVPPLVFATYSLTCFWTPKQIKPWMLLALVLGNLSYCLVAVLFVFSLNGVTNWGRGYFILESLIVAGVVALEIAVYRRSFRQLNRKGKIRS